MGAGKRRKGLTMAKLPILQLSERPPKIISLVEYRLQHRGWRAPGSAAMDRFMNVRFPIGLQLPAPPMPRDIRAFRRGILIA